MPPSPSQRRRCAVFQQDTPSVRLVALATPTLAAAVAVVA
eukprot:CAMPEP_0113986954 /NCGR_PEP_ID=MMETSP0328-20130328/6733_1 /TAXON_ID=39455 /ORGANISM="Alexandrium minutum" /LENGTH=39 /assembly_acc=CAM_ASM_000350